MTDAKRLNVLSVVVALDMAGFGMVISDIQLRLEGMRVPGYVIGAVLSSMFLVQFPASILWGRATDRIGGRIVITICTCLSAASMLVYGFARTPYAILSSRVLAGLGAANVSTAFAITSVVATAEARPKMIGRLGASVVFGLTCGSALGGIMVERFGQTTLGFAACGASGLAALLATLAPTTPKKLSEEKKKFAFSYRGPLLALMAIAATGWISLATLEGTFGRLIHATLGLGQREFGFIFGFESLIGFVVQAFAFDPLAKRLVAHRLLAAAFLLTGLGLLAMPFAPSLSVLLSVAAVYAVGNALATPALNELIARYTSEDERGEVYGAAQSLRSLGFIVGPSIGGALFDYRVAAPYVVAAVMCAVVSVFSLRILNR